MTKQRETGKKKQRRTVRDAMISRVIEEMLCALDGDGAFRRQELGHGETVLESEIFGVVDGADEAVAEGFVGAKGARRETDVLDPAGGATDDFGQPAERANVRGQADVNFLDGEAGGAGAEADVGAGAEVDGEANGMAVKDADYGC